MKKGILLIFLISFIFLTGCFGKGKSKIDSLKSKIEKSKSYTLNGELQIVNNDDNYLYTVNVSYMDDNYFKVSLKNQTNNHEQIILKNKDGVFVLTPNLNKNFKFQSEWPYNNSQIYLLQTLIKDIEDDKEYKITSNNKKTIITAKTNYTNNPELIKQQIYIDEKNNVTEVRVLDEKDNIKMKMLYKNTKYNVKISKDDFSIENNMNVSTILTTSKEIKDVVYPMSLPENTYLQSQNKVTTSSGERVILTFAGEKPFTIIEETANVTKKIETTSVSGEPEILAGAIGIVNNKEVTWLNNGVSYYVTSDNLNNSELLKIVKSVSNNVIEK